MARVERVGPNRWRLTTAAGDHEEFSSPPPVPRWCEFDDHLRAALVAVNNRRMGN
jgi:hypothetical protein